jgi:recombination protein RecT
MSDLVPYQSYQEIVNYGRSPEVMQSFARLLGRDAPHYVQSAIMAVQANDRLLQCTPRSIFQSALRAATLRLSCDPALGHAWLVPYKNKNGGLEAQFQAGWKGVQHMALRTGKYRYINVAPIFDGEEVIEDRITGSLSIEGERKYPKKEVGLIASFALLSGYAKSIFMTFDEMEAHGKKYSKSYNRPDSVWNTNKAAAYHKTILLKLLRTYGYLNPSDAAILEDDQVEVSDLELPDESDVTIIESKPITTKEANRILGMDDDDEPEPKPKPEVVEAEVSTDPMTIEDACKVETSDNPPKRYGDLTMTELVARFNELNYQLKHDNLEPDERAIKERKMNAAKMVIDAKRNKEI